MSALVPPRPHLTRLLAALALGVLLSGCTLFGPAPGPATSPTPIPSAGGSPSPGATATPAPTSPPTGAPSTVASCTGAIPASDNLILGQLIGSTTVVLRDITNLASPTNLCTFTGAIAPHFASASVVAYAQQGADLGSAGKILRLDLAAASITTSASWSAGSFGSGNFDWSPDGAAFTYVGPGSTGPAWHLLHNGRDQLLSQLPAVPGRGVSKEDDDFMVGFSPDGLYLALVQTFATGGSGESSPLQIRRVADGGMVYSAAAGTMAVWASVPSRLFFRDSAGTLLRWDPSTGVSRMSASLKWTRPHASPDGRWVAYTIYDNAGHPHVSLYSVQGNSIQAVVGGIRSGALFLNNNLLWYQEEAACDCGLAGQSQLTGRTFLYDIGAGSEGVSRLAAVYDAWPRVTAPPSLPG